MEGREKDKLGIVPHCYGLKCGIGCFRIPNITLWGNGAVAHPQKEPGGEIIGGTVQVLFQGLSCLLFLTLRRAAGGRFVQCGKTWIYTGPPTKLTFLNPDGIVRNFGRGPRFAWVFTKWLNSFPKKPFRQITIWAFTPADIPDIAGVFS